MRTKLCLYFIKPLLIYKVRRKLRTATFLNLLNYYDQKLKSCLKIKGIRLLSLQKAKNNLTDVV